MASVDTSFGYPVGLPSAISVTGGTNTQIVVPAFSYNSGAPVPSPVLLAGAPLYIQVPPDVATGSVDWDGHPFRVRFAGKITTGTGGTTFAPNIYLGNNATITNNVALTAVSNDTVTASASTNFLVEAVLLWDSTSLQVNGTYSYHIANGTIGAGAAITTQGTSIAMTGLVFTAAVQFAGTAVNTVTITEFTISRF